jgi:hypothetical protein
MREALHHLVVQGCCAAGGLTGLWLGFIAAPKRGASPDLPAALAEVLLPVGWRVGAGVLAGALAAWLLGGAFRWLQPGER